MATKEESIAFFAKHFNYPGRFKIVLHKDHETKKLSIVTTQERRTKTMIDNLKFKSVQQLGFSGHMVTLDIVDCETVEEHLDHIDTQQNYWIDKEEV